MTLDELRALAASVGFPNPSLAAAVAAAESRGNPNIVGDQGTSFGLWQIHTPAHPEFDAASLLDPTYNAQAALMISKGGTNWTPWSTFNDGTYRRYLGGAPAPASSSSTATNLAGFAVGALVATVTSLAVNALWNHLAHAPATRTA